MQLTRKLKDVVDKGRFALLSSGHRRVRPTIYCLEITQTNWSKLIPERANGY